MSDIENIAFSCDLTLDENQKLKALSEYNKRSMRKQFRAMIDEDYEEMKRNLN